VSAQSACRETDRGGDAAARGRETLGSRLDARRTRLMPPASTRGRWPKCSARGALTSALMSTSAELGGRSTHVREYYADLPNTRYAALETYMPSNLTISEQLTYSTVRIECLLSDGTAGTGTGFFYKCLDVDDQHVPVIVTNKHVIATAIEGRFHLTLRDDEGNPCTGQHLHISLGNFEQRWIRHPDPDVDMCVMPINPLLQEADTAGHRFFYVPLDKALIPSPTELDDLGALEDVIMIGYPNGIWDHVNNMPIIRRGVTATHPNLNYEGRKEFMIDAACFPGSSGSPVFLYNNGSWANRAGGMVVGGVRVKLLGLLYAGPQHTASGEVQIVTVPTQQRAIAVSSIPNNLGLIIKSARLLEMDDVIRPLIAQAAA